MKITEQDIENARQQAEAVLSDLWVLDAQLALMRVKLMRAVHKLDDLNARLAAFKHFVDKDNNEA